MNKFKLMLALLAAPAMVLTSCGGDDTQQTEGSISKVTVSCASSVMVGKSVTATANVSASGGAKKTVTWSTSDSTVATVSSSGKITGKKVGKATITATSTVDKSKSASVEISVVPAAWTDEELEIFDEVIPEPIPYITGNWSFVEDYIEDYGVLLLESSDSKALATAKKAFEDDPKFNYLGTSYDEEYDCDDYYYARPSLDYLGYETFIDIYELDGTTTVQISFQNTEYDEWPADEIASYMSLLGYQGTVPELSAGADGWYTASPEEFEDGSEGIYITLGSYDELYAEDVVASLNPSDYSIWVDEYGDYYVSPIDKSFTMIMYDDFYAMFSGYCGVVVIVTEYVKDYSLELLPTLDLVAVNGTLQMDVVKGEDFDASDVIEYASSDNSIATVSDDGLVTGVKEGEVTITASFSKDGEVVSSASSTLYVVNEVKNAFSVEELAEFDKLHPGKDFSIPFNKFYSSVSYDEEKEEVNVVGRNIDNMTFESIYDDMIAGGWSDVDQEYYQAIADEYEITLEEAREYVFSEYGYYEFEKQIDDYVVTADLYVIIEIEGEEYLGDEGIVHVDLYDVNFYDYADAIEAVEAMLEEAEVETTAEFPESLPAGRYSVYYDSYDKAIVFDAFNAPGISLDDLVTALNAKNWTVSKEHVDASQGNPEYDYLVGSSIDEVLGIEGYVEDNNIELVLALPVMEVTDTLTIDDLLPEGTKATVYSDFYDVEGTSGAVYAGQCALSDATHGSCIQIRSKNSNSGIYSDESAGTLVSITINFSEKNTSTKNIKIVASNEPFESTEDLYSATVVGTVTDVDGVGYYEFEEDYSYFGIISADGAFYIDSIDVVWLA